MLSPIEKETIVADENERSVIINESQPLARYSVLYLGTAVPSVDQRGIDSVQEPISKRYPIGESGSTVRGIEAWLSIDQNGLQIQFVSDPSVMLYYPIRSLVYCASVRFATRTVAEEPFPNGWRFVPLDNPDADLDENMQNPPLFTVVFHRTRELPMDECHCFVTKTKQVALALVEACSDAYQGTDPVQDCSKVPLYFKIMNDGLQLKEIDNEISLTPALDDEQISDYQINNKSAGFFYKTEEVLIDHWQLWENPKHILRRSPSAQSSSSSSSRSSNRHRHHRRLASITSIPESEKPSKFETTSTIEPIAESPQLMVDPYAPDPNVLRVERIKDVHTGRDIFIRWLRDPIESPLPPPPPPPTTPAPNYDFHVDFNTDYQSEKELPKEIQRLEINDRPSSTESKKSKKKEKHRKHKHHHEKKHSQHLNQTILPLIQAEFQMPPSFETMFSNVQQDSSPFWFSSM